MVTCGSTVDIPRGGKCNVIFKVRNTGTKYLTFDYFLDIFDSRGAIVGSKSYYEGISLSPGGEITVVATSISINSYAATGLGNVRVIILDHTTGAELDRESCRIVNIV